MPPNEQIEDLANRKQYVLEHKDRMVAYSVYVRRGKFDNAELNKAILRNLSVDVCKVLARLIETDYKDMARFDRTIAEVKAKRDEKPPLSFEADIMFNFD